MENSVFQKNNVDNLFESRHCNTVLRQVYGEMLHRFPVREVLEFWDEVGIVTPSGLMTLPDKLRWLWGENKTHVACTRDYHNVRVHLHRFLAQRGIALQEFMLETARGFTFHPVINSREILVLLKPWFHMIFSGGDLRLLYLKLLDKIHTNMGFPGWAELVGQDVHFGRRKDHVLFSWEKDCLEPADLDFENFILPFFLESPRLLNQKAISSYSLKADSRNIKYVVPDLSIRNGICYSGNQRIGFEQKFSQFAENLGLKIRSLRIPDHQGVVLEKDFLDLKTGKPLLHQGCFYNSQVVLVCLEYESIRKFAGNPLEILVDALITPDNSFWQKAAEIHAFLLQQLEEALEITYFHENESISVGNNHLVRSMPAKILRNVLREYIQNGRVEFENLEFKRDPDICMDSLNPNFEGRLARLMKRLAEENYGFGLKRSSRGKFSLETAVKIDFREQ